MSLNITKLSKLVHGDQRKKWWVNLKTGKPLARNKGEILMLVITELSEAVEGIRKNLMDDKIPHRTMEEVEMADAVIRLLDYMGGFKLKESDGCVPWLGVMKKNKSESILNICQRVSDIYYYAGTDLEAAKVTATIRCIEVYCNQNGLDLKGAVKEKIKFNRTRADHSRKHRMSKNGKKF